MNKEPWYIHAFSLGIVLVGWAFAAHYYGWQLVLILFLVEWSHNIDRHWGKL